MVSIDEELEAALAALVTIHALSTSSPKPHIVTALRKAKLAARPITDFTRNASIVETRDKVVNALSDLIRAIEEGPPTQAKIDKAKGAVEVWVYELLD